MAALGSLLGGLQSSRNPGANMTPGVKPYRRSRLGLSTGPQLGRPGTGLAGVIGGVRTTAAAPPPNAVIPGGPRPTPPPALPGRLPPLPPITPPGGVAGALPNAPGASLLQFDQWLATQPLWIQQQAADVAANNNLMAGYGFYKDAAGNLVADPKASQDSVIAQEDLQRQRGIGHTAQAGANHGNLFSGASLLGVQNADDAYRAGAAKALRDLTEKTGAITQHELDTKIGMSTDYTDYVGNSHVAAPEDALAKFAGDKSPANAIAGIDQYLKAYGKYLTPAQMTAFAHARAVQANIFSHTPPPRPPVVKKTIKKKAAKNSKTAQASQRAGSGLYGGNQGGGSAARGGG